MTTKLVDARGDEIKVGDKIAVTCRDASRGAHLFMCQGTWTVTALGRSRITITTGWYAIALTVGPECCQIMTAVDGRKLSTWDEVHGR